MEPGLEAVSYYAPPNITYPFGAHVCVKDTGVETGVPEIRRFYAPDDCGLRINPMITEGQVHGGLTGAPAAGAYLFRIRLVRITDALRDKVALRVLGRLPRPPEVCGAVGKLASDTEDPPFWHVSTRWRAW